MQKRHFKKWAVNELLALQREHELLGWSVDEIAEKHQRTKEAILYRLQEEGFIEKINKEENPKTSKLDERIGNLEISVSEIKLLVKEMVGSFMDENKRIKNKGVNNHSVSLLENKKVSLR